MNGILYLLFTSAYTSSFPISVRHNYCSPGLYFAHFLLVPSPNQLSSHTDSLYLIALKYHLFFYLVIDTISTCFLQSELPTPALEAFFKLILHVVAKMSILKHRSYDYMIWNLSKSNHRLYDKTKHVIITFKDPL